MKRNEDPPTELLFSPMDAEKFKRGKEAYGFDYCKSREKQAKKESKLADNLMKAIDGCDKIRANQDVVTSARAFARIAGVPVARRDYSVGLGDIGGTKTRNIVNPVTDKQRKVFSSVEIAGRHYDFLPLTGRWRKLLGKPASDAKVMIFGKPGQGKSTFAIQFAAYLAKELHKSVLYVAAEEKIGATLNEKLDRLNARCSNLYVCGDLPQDLSPFDAVFLDSVNFMNLEPQQLMNMQKGKFYFYVFQSTKSGLFRGSNEYSHDVDVVIKAEKMVATIDKNRYGGDGEPMEIVTANKPEGK